MESTTNYQAAWRDYRRRRAILGAAFVGGLAAVWLFVTAFDLSTTARQAIGGAWCVALMMAGVYFGFFPCPRCGKTMRRGWRRRGFRWGCEHCGLRIGEDPAQKAEAPPAVK